MQIEESFRDLKSPQYELGLRHSHSRCTKRSDILLLIATVAEWLLGLIGMIAHKHQGTILVTIQSYTSVVSARYIGLFSILTPVKVSTIMHSRRRAVSLVHVVYRSHIDASLDRPL